nr:AAA family ATPase [Roseomonas rosulenta]
MQLRLAARPDAPPQAFLDRLANLVERTQQLAAPPVRTELRLEQLHGFGAAGAWARRTADRLLAYRAGQLDASDLPRGALLVGPPGVGKTLLVQALANSAAVPLVSGSLARWQAADDGHLGTTLRAMRRTFDAARAAAPSVLLIDELDSFGSRDDFAAPHRDYATQVVNALLELLDGAEPRLGVVVVGTCNDARRIDPAILRAGRIDDILELGPPDAAALVAIARLYLAEAMAEDDASRARLAAIGRAAAARGGTGAAMEQWCREARERARQDGRRVTLDDLATVIGPPPPPPTRAELHRAALHEAAHCAAVVALDPALVVAVRLSATPAPSGHTELAAHGRGLSGPFPTRRDVLRSLRVLLAGRAAERVCLGEVSAGAGGSDASDLARATRLALTAVTSLGLGEEPAALIWRAADHGDADRLLMDPLIQQRVAALLGDALAAAEGFVRANEASIRRLADELLARGNIGGADVVAILGSLVEPPVPEDDRATTPERATTVR